MPEKDISNQNPYLIKANTSAEDIVDDVQDALWRAEGKQVAKNTHNTCPGGQTISTCPTTRNLIQTLLKNAYNVEIPEDLPEDIAYEAEGNKHTVKTHCEDCGFNCQTIHRVTENGGAQEKVRFMFKDPDTEHDEDGKQQSSKKSRTSFMEEYGLDWFKPMPFGPNKYPPLNPADLDKLL